MAAMLGSHMVNTGASSWLQIVIPALVRITMDHGGARWGIVGRDGSRGIVVPEVLCGHLVRVLTLLYLSNHLPDAMEDGFVLWDHV